MQTFCMTSKNNDKLMLAVKCYLQVLSEILEMYPGSTAISAFILTYVLATPNYPVEIFGLVRPVYIGVVKQKRERMITI